MRRSTEKRAGQIHGFLQSDVASGPGSRGRDICHPTSAWAFIFTRWSCRKRVSCGCALSAEGLHADRADDHRGGHRHPFLTRAPGLSGLLGAHENVGGDPGADFVPGQRNRGLPDRSRPRARTERLGLRSRRHSGNDIRFVGHDDCRWRHQRHRTRHSDGGERRGGHAGAARAACARNARDLRAGTSQPLYGWRCGSTADGTTVAARYLPSSCRG